MTEEEKSLLLQDLCARLPYGVRVQCLQDTKLRYDGYKIHELSEDGSYLSLLSVDIPHGACGLDLGICDIKPYLRPMSSMTNKEKLFLINFLLDNPEKSILTKGLFIQDYLNKHFFDYRGFIEKDLALEVPEGMYNN